MNGQRQVEIVKDDDSYTLVLNDLIFDDSLRLQTRMVLIMMTSVRPDWDFSIRGMAKIAHVTKDTMSKMMVELEAAGYVKRKEQTRGSTGQFAKAGYLVSRKPIFRNNADAKHKNYDTVPPCPNSSYTTEPYTKNSPQLNTKQLITEQVNSPYSPPEGDGAPGEQDGERRHSGADELSPQEEASERSLCRRGDKPDPKPKRCTQSSTPNRAPERGKKRFIPPNVDEVRAYCQERENGIDPEAFIAFYASKGWMVGRSPMRDWKAAVHTWERRRAADGKGADSHDDWY